MAWCLLIFCRPLITLIQNGSIVVLELCRLDEFVNDFGFPMPKVDVEIHGVDDISLIDGVIAWGENKTVTRDADSSPGPVTRSQSSSPPISVVTPVPETRVRASASFDQCEFLGPLSCMCWLILLIVFFRISGPSDKGPLLTLRQTKSMIRKLPSSLRFRGKNLNPDRGTVMNLIASKRYSSFIGFSVHDNSLMNFRCRACYKEYPYSGGIATVKRHMAYKSLMCRMNSYRLYMGLDLVDSSNVEHSYISRVAVRDLLPILSGVPALPLELFAVLDDLPKDLFPPSEVMYIVSFSSFSFIDVAVYVFPSLLV